MIIAHNPTSPIVNQLDVLDNSSVCNNHLTKLLSRPWHIMLIAAGAALALGLTILHAQFVDEDELLVLQRATELIQCFATGKPGFIEALTSSSQPPGRNLLPIPFIILLGPTEAALRWPNLLFWAATCGLAARIGLRLNGPAVGLVTGLVLALSGLFQVESMAHGFSVTNFLVLWLVDFLLKNQGWGLAIRRAKRQYLLECGIVFMGVCFFTSLLPVAGMHLLVHGWQCIRRHGLATGLHKWLIWTLPAAAPYFLYFIFFFGLPYLDLLAGRNIAPNCQLIHFAQRTHQGGLNIHSLVENSQGLNWYVFPALSSLFLVFGMWRQLTRYTSVFIIVFPYIFLFCCYIKSMTGAHFLSAFIWSTPFAVAALSEIAARYPLRLQANIAAATLAILLAWTWFCHLRTYTEENYPIGLSKIVFGDIYWCNNVYFPYEAATRDLKKILAEGERLVVTAYTPIQYYISPQAYLYNDPIFDYTKPGDLTSERIKQLRLRAITMKRGTQLSSTIHEEYRLTYSGSMLEITVLRRL
ncbi:conserved membrane hypothetical protein [Desulfovibrionales bacterium]